MVAQRSALSFASWLDHSQHVVALHQSSQAVATLCRGGLNVLPIMVHALREVFLGNELQDELDDTSA